MPQLQSQPSKRKPRKSRAKGLRTTTGCTVCRQRHLKCGEEKPQCGNCSRAGRDCLWGVPSTHTRSSSATQDLTVLEQDNDEPNLDVAGQDEPAYNPEDGITISPEATGQDEYQHNTMPGGPPAYSPMSTLSSTASIGPETGPLRWFSLVTTDYQNSQQASGATTSLFRETTQLDPLLRSGKPVADTLGYQASGTSDGINPRSGLNLQFSPRSAQGELPSWYSEVSLRDDEVPILENFCNNIADWLDALDPMKHFASAVPQLAMRNEGLMKAMLALSARHMSLQQRDTPTSNPANQTVALQYYHDTLQYLHNAMKHPEYLKSIEVNATSLILSTYEMIDGMGRGWIRHLKGVFWIQRSQNTSADSGGLKAAIWWAWLRQDTWAALREKRRVLTIHNFNTPISDMNFWQHANFVSFLFALCVSYISKEESQVEGDQLQKRIDRAKYLSSALEEWFYHLPDNFKALPVVLPGFAKEGPFRPVWINPPSFGTVLQMYQASKVILLAHAPAVGGFREFGSRNRQLVEAIDTICGIAMTVKDGGSSLVSISCLWASGLCTQDDIRREAIANLIREHRNITGWPVTDLGNELRQEWAEWE